MAWASLFEFRVSQPAEKVRTNPRLFYQPSKLYCLHLKARSAKKLSRVSPTVSPRSFLHPSKKDTVKKTSSKEKTPAKRKPQMKWQTGAYDRYAEFRFILPQPFLLLCRLMDITPEALVRDFTDNLAFGSFKRQESEKAREQLVNYFIAQGYGRHQYTEAEIRGIFTEMDALGLLFPTGGGNKIIEQYCAWRDRHQRHWFKQWYRKHDRQPLKKGGS